MQNSLIAKLLFKTKKTMLVNNACDNNFAEYCK